MQALKTFENFDTLVVAGDGRERERESKRVREQERERERVRKTKRERESCKIATTSCDKQEDHRDFSFCIKMAGNKISGEKDLPVREARRREINRSGVNTKLKVE